MKFAAKIRAQASRIPEAMRAALLYASGIFVAKGAAFLVVPILTRMLSPQVFGRLDLLSSAAEIGAMFTSAGLVDTLYRFASGRNDPRKASADVLGLATAISLLATLLTFLIADPVASAIPLATSPTEIILLGIAVAVESSVGVPLAWLRMNDRAGLYVTATILRAVVQSALVAGLVLHGTGIMGILMAGAFVAIASALGLGIIQGRSTGVGIHPRNWVGLLGYGVPLVGSGLASFALGTADRWFLAPSIGAITLGCYALACKFGMVAAMCTQPLDLWWYPKRIGLATTTRGLANSARTVDRLAAYSMVTAAFCAVAGPAAIIVITPAEYHPAAFMAPWLVLTICLQQLGSLVNVGCYLGKTGARPMMVNSVAAIVAVGGYLALIPSMGVTGAIGATVVAQTVRLVLFHAISRRIAPIPHRFGLLGVIAAMSALAAAVPRLVSIWTEPLVQVVPRQTYGFFALHDGSQHYQIPAGALNGAAGGLIAVAAAALTAVLLLKRAAYPEREECPV